MCADEYPIDRGTWPSLGCTRTLVVETPSPNAVKGARNCASHPRLSNDRRERCTKARMSHQAEHLTPHHAEHPDADRAEQTAADYSEHPTANRAEHRAEHTTAHPRTTHHFEPALGIRTRPPSEGGMATGRKAESLRADGQDR